jgi:Domain of unknown function (DUF4149)
MNSFCRFLQIFSLGTWLGGILFLSFVEAPGAFTLIPSRDVAGSLVGFSLTRLHVFGVIAGMVFLLASAFRGALSTGVGKAAMLAAALMVLLTGISQWGVSSRMTQLRAQMRSVDATPLDNPVRAEFDRLHGISVSLEGTVMLLGFAALYLTARG